MSRHDAGRFTDAATLAHLVEDALNKPAGEDDTSVQGHVCSECAMPPRPFSAARVGPSRNAHSRPYNDPSNYLG
jgi:hypothetical protein